MEVSRIDPEKLMSLYSIVFQDVTLFDNTIMENIRLGRKGRKGATDEEVLAAAKLANCEEFADCREAAGQMEHQHRRERLRPFRRRASAHFHRPRLPERCAHHPVGRGHRQLGRGKRNCHSLSRLIKNKTVLIIAHRMRTVAGADQVVVLSGGIVAEQGSPAELYARKGLYTHMVDLQSASQNWTI